MGRLFGNPVFIGLMITSLVCGIVLLTISLWLKPLTKAEFAVGQDEFESALEYFQLTESRFNKLDFTKKLFPEAYLASRANQFHLLYLLNDYESLLEHAGTEPVHIAAYFWAGCALLRKAMDEEEPDSKIVWLERALSEFRSALEVEPENWAIKFNFELTGQILADLREEQEPPPTELPELLRPQPQEGEMPFRPLG